MSQDKSSNNVVGRPNLSITEKRLKRINISFNSEEYTILNNNIEGTIYNNYSSFIRDIIFDKLPLETNLQHRINISKYLFVLSKLSNNVNQIARKLNSHEQFSLSKDDQELLSELSTFFKNVELKL